MPNLNELAALLAEQKQQQEYVHNWPYIGRAPAQDDLDRVERQLLEAMPALVEALRWRDAETEPPELAGRYRVLWVTPLNTKRNLPEITAYLCRRYSETWWENERRQLIEVAYWQPLGELPQEQE